MEAAQVQSIVAEDQRPPLEDVVDVNDAGRQRRDVNVDDSLSDTAAVDNNRMMTTGEEGMAWIAGGGRWDDAGPDGKNGKIRKIIEEGVSAESRRTVDKILDQVNQLSTAEKLLLYLKLPTSSGQHIDPLRQPLNPLGSRSEIHQTITWIKTHLQEDQEVSMPKQDIYDEYMSFCDLSAMKPLSTADFGKVMKQVFPSVRPRRLGTRGNSRYCYAGMRKRTTLQPPQLPDMQDRDDQMPDEGCADEVSKAAVCLVRDWAEKLLGTRFASLQDLAHHLVTNMCVDSRSTASATLLAALEPATKITDGQDVAARPNSKHRDTQLQLQRKLQEREVIREQKRKLQDQQHHPRQRSQSADKPRAKRAKVKESEDRFVQHSNHNSSEAECDVKPTVEYVDYSTVEPKTQETASTRHLKSRGLSLDFEPNLSLVLENARASAQSCASAPPAPVGATPSPPVTSTLFSFSPQTVAKVQIPRLPKLKREVALPPLPVIHLSPPGRNKYQLIQPKIDQTAKLEETLDPQPKTPTKKSPGGRGCNSQTTNGKSPSKRCKLSKNTAPKSSLKSKCATLTCDNAMGAKCLGYIDKTDLNLPSSFSSVIPRDKGAATFTLSSFNQSISIPQISSLGNSSTKYTSSFTSVPPREKAAANNEPQARSSGIMKVKSRVRNEVSIGCLEKDALDDYLDGGSNSQEQEEELMRYFQHEERPPTDTKLSQLRQLLERNQDQRPASHSLSILSQRSQHRSNLPTRRRVSFETQDVPPSPNTRRRIFSFTPISPGPHSPLSRNASKPSSANASPFVSPRNTPVPRTKTSYLATYLSNPRPNIAASLERSISLSSEVQPSLHVDTAQTFTMPTLRSYVSASAPQSPLVNHLVNPFDGKARANSFQGPPSGLEALLAEMARAKCAQQAIGGQFMGAGEAVVEPAPVAEAIVQDSGQIYPLAKSYYRSQSVPLHRMLDATPMPSEYQDFGPDILLDTDETNAADVGLNSENLSRIFNLLDEQDDPAKIPSQPTFTDPRATFTSNNPRDLVMDGAYPSHAHDLTMPENYTENAQDLAITGTFIDNSQALNLEGTFPDNPHDLPMAGAYAENPQVLTQMESYCTPAQELVPDVSPYVAAPLPYKSTFEYVANGTYRAMMQNGMGPRRNIATVLESGQYAASWSNKACDTMSQLEEEADKL